MKRSALLLSVLLTSAMVAGCKHDKEPNKIIDALPVHINETCPPAQATQAWFALKRDCLSTIVPVVNRIGITGFTFPELTPIGGMEYTFTREDRHYGTAHVTIQFRDPNNAPVDPITNPTFISTTTLQSVAISVTGNFTGFNYNESLTLTLDVAGNTTGTKHLTGTSNFNGSSYALTYTFATGGSNSTFEGMTDGSVNATGTGPSGAPVTISMTFYPEHTANGTIVWEGNNGSLHLDNSAAGLLITSQYRLPLD